MTCSKIPLAEFDLTAALFLLVHLILLLFLSLLLFDDLPVDAAQIKGVVVQMRVCVFMRSRRALKRVNLVLFGGYSTALNLDSEITQAQTDFVEVDDKDDLGPGGEEGPAD